MLCTLFETPKIRQDECAPVQLLRSGVKGCSAFEARYGNSCARGKVVPDLTTGVGRLARRRYSGTHNVGFANIRHTTTTRGRRSLSMLPVVQKS